MMHDPQLLHARLQLHDLNMMHATLLLLDLHMLHDLQMLHATVLLYDPQVLRTDARLIVSFFTHLRILHCSMIFPVHKFKNLPDLPGSHI